MRIVCFIALLAFHYHVLAACDNESARNQLSQLTWLTEDYPPYNFKDEDGNIVGIFSEALFAIYNQLSIPLTQEQIHVVPWARLYHTVQHQVSSAGFSMVNTRAREEIFSLVALPIITKISIMALSKNVEALRAKPLNELTIAVVREDIGQHMLAIHNIQAQLQETTSAVSMLSMLLYERVDAIAYAEDVVHYQNEKLGLTERKIESFFILNDKLYTSFAFNKSMPKCTVELFRQTANTLFEQGKFTQIWQKYLNKEEAKH